MFVKTSLPADPAELHALILENLRGYLDASLPAVSNYSNMSAILMHFLPRINWVGFYLREGEKLILGPFQGLPACTEIAIGKGVCGTAALLKETVVVEDVERFPGHIACDSASRSEIVVPIIQNGNLLGVLDVDSPDLGRFRSADRALLEQAVDVLIDNLR
ncbi:MAG TPA: GAF domain-containing protein [Candidatus Izemoplasmatales bacterium]|nr:GAF domain-containing protein [Bacillota bacterium]HRY77396.1 GAF domain-containing protein [Candidatus Izemoplasmatales bacterium]